MASSSPSSPSPSRWNPRKWNFDIDRYLNPWTPCPPWHRVPTPVSHFFGHRHKKPEPLGNVLLIFWAFIGIFCSISIIEVVSDRVPSFRHNGTPIIVGSFGAAAVLEFYSIDSPLAQPRNAVFGQLVSCIIGTAICKLFLLSPHFDDIRWVAGALACAAATSVMAITKTVHPPAGATALLAVVDDNIVSLGWFLIPVVMLGCALMLVVALLVNNIQRRFPAYWWTPEDLRGQERPWRKWGKGGHRTAKEKEAADLEDARSKESDSQHESENPNQNRNQNQNQNQNQNESGSGSDNENEGARVWETTNGELREGLLVIKPGVVCVPEYMYLSPEEKLILESLSSRL